MSPRRTHHTLLGTALAVLLAMGFGAWSGSGSAAAGPPDNTSPPTISGTLLVGSTLTGNSGNWSGATPISFQFFWHRCDTNGRGCAYIAGAHNQTYKLSAADDRHTLKLVVRASNSAGSRTANSPVTRVVTQAPSQPSSTGCPPGGGPDRVSDVSAPARLLIDAVAFEPNVQTSSNRRLRVRFHVSSTCGHSVSGAVVYATAVPFNQLSIPSEQPTGSDGWVELSFDVLRGFPVSAHQQLLVYFARARKPGEGVLTGISTRRLVSQRVKLGS